MSPFESISDLHAFLSDISAADREDLDLVASELYVGLLRGIIGPPTTMSKHECPVCWNSCACCLPPEWPHSDHLCLCGSRPTLGTKLSFR